MLRPAYKEKRKPCHETFMKIMHDFDQRKEIRVMNGEDVAYL